MTIKEKSIDVSKDGNLLVAFSAREVNIYDVSESTLKKTIKFETDVQDVILKPSDPAFAFIVHSDNRVVYFHLFAAEEIFQLDNPEEEVKFLKLHPSSEQFLLGTTRMISLVDYGSQPRQVLAKVSTFGDTIAGAFDSQGMIFALCLGKNVIHLYDTKGFAKGPFDKFPDLEKPCAHIEFSSCGKYCDFLNYR